MCMHAYSEHLNCNSDRSHRYMDMLAPAAYLVLAYQRTAKGVARPPYNLSRDFLSYKTYKCYARYLIEILRWLRTLDTSAPLK